MDPTGTPASAPTYTPRTIIGPDAAAAHVDHQGLIHDTANDVYLQKTSVAGDGVLEIEPVTFAATAVATTGGSGIATKSHGVYTCFLWSERLQGAFYVGNHDEPVRFLLRA